MSAGKDYRIRRSASKRTVEAKSAIREALRLGKETFGELMAETRLSRPALAANLKKMCREKEIDRKMDTEDYRITRYTLTDKGLKQYKKQKDLESLSDMGFLEVGELMNVIKGAMVHVMNGVTVFLESHEWPATYKGQKVILTAKEMTRFPHLRKKEREILRNCFSISVYSRSKENESISFMETLKEYVALVKSLASGKDIDPQRLEKLPNLTFMFQLDRGRLISQYEHLRKKESGQP